MRGGCEWVVPFERLQRAECDDSAIQGLAQHGRGCHARPLVHDASLHPAARQAGHEGSGAAAAPTGWRCPQPTNKAFLDPIKSIP